MTRAKCDPHEVSSCQRGGRLLIGLRLSRDTSRAMGRGACPWDKGKVCRGDFVHFLAPTTLPLPLNDLLPKQF